jgi:hypothetical protein
MLQATVRLRARAVLIRRFHDLPGSDAIANSSAFILSAVGCSPNSVIRASAQIAVGTAST